MTIPFRKLLLAVPVIAAALLLPPATASTTGSPGAPRVVSVDGSWRIEGRPPHPGRRVVVGAGKKAATLALRMVGVPYRWGGESPGSGFDCSGLIRWAYGQVGVDLPHNSHALYGVGVAVPSTRLQSGDVLFFSGLGHVGLYLGGGRMVHAPQSGKTVELVNLRASHYGGRLVGARRVAS